MSEGGIQIGNPLQLLVIGTAVTVLGYGGVLAINLLASAPEASLAYDLGHALVPGRSLACFGAWFRLSTVFGPFLVALSLIWMVLNAIRWLGVLLGVLLLYVIALGLRLLGLLRR